MRLIIPSYLGITIIFILKEPYSAPHDNLEGHKADYVDHHRMWTIRSSLHQSIWIGTKDSLLTITGTDGFLLAPTQACVAYAKQAHTRVTSLTLERVKD